MWRSGGSVFSEIFKVFSRREIASAGQKSKPLSKEFRNRVVMLLQDQLRGSFTQFLEQLHRQVSFQHGTPRLSPSLGRGDKADDLFDFLFSCKDEHFLDVIELIFKSNLPGITWPDNPLIPSINEFLNVDDLPYHLTSYTVETYQTTYFGNPTTAIRITEFPRIIRKENEVLHQEAVDPALHLLSAEIFKHANTEFLKALEDYRKGDFRDCLTKCGSAFESTMKVICDKKAISFKQTDTAAVLLRALLAKSKLETYWEQPLILIATLRNRLSSSHGAGGQSIVVPRHVARYAINATASAIVLLVDEFL
jgi:hypothetical protein